MSLSRRDGKVDSPLVNMLRTPINKQSPDVGIGDQETTFEYPSVSEETRSRLEVLTDELENGDLRILCPNGKHVRNKHARKSKRRSLKSCD